MVLECIKNLFKKKEKEKVTILEDSIQLDDRVAKYRIVSVSDRVDLDTVVEIKFSQFIEILNRLQKVQKELDELKERVK